MLDDEEHCILMADIWEINILPDWRKETFCNQVDEGDTYLRYMCAGKGGTTAKEWSGFTLYWRADHIFLQKVLS